MTSGYILVTKYYNERKLLPQLIENIANQTLEPYCVVLIDDGSTDGSTEVGIETARKEDLEVEVVSMPQKDRGNLDTLGIAWNKAQPLLKKLARRVDYVATADVDTQFPQEYFEKGIKFLDSHPSVGVVSGQIAGEEKRHFPMFTGKIVRSQVIQSIDKYWDISVDSFINIKAIKMGFDVKIMDDLEVKSKPSHLVSSEGKFRAGRIAYYAGVHPKYAIVKALAKRDSDFLRGYWQEYHRGTWRCQDEDIREYYDKELYRKIMSSLNKVLGLNLNLRGVSAKESARIITDSLKEGG